MKEHTLYSARGTLRWSGTAVMGILNVTPDSFSDGSSDRSAEQDALRGLTMMNEGALLVDVGGESTRPGARPVGAQEELDRVLPVITRLAQLGVPVSIDTLKPEVAAAALEAGAWLVNDVGGLRDPEMTEVCVRHGSPAVIMHMQGEPLTMQDNPAYVDVVREVSQELVKRATMATEAGLKSLLIDPGIGFGKNLQHNLELLANLEQLTGLGWPLLLGASRKGMLGQLTSVTRAADRDAASIAVHLHGARLGAAMVRVHDVAGHVQALTVQQAISGYRAEPAGQRPKGSEK